MLRVLQPSPGDSEWGGGAGRTWIWCREVKWARPPSWHCMQSKCVRALPAAGGARAAVPLRLGDRHGPGQHLLAGRKAGDARQHGGGGWLRAEAGGAQWSPRDDFLLLLQPPIPASGSGAPKVGAAPPPARGFCQHRRKKPAQAGAEAAAPLVSSMGSRSREPGWSPACTACLRSARNAPCPVLFTSLVLDARCAPEGKAQPTVLPAVELSARGLGSCPDFHL